MLVGIRDPGSGIRDPLVVWEMVGATPFCGFRLCTPAEAFAEIGAHLMLDPKARAYLPAGAAAYFDREVFVPARPARRIE